MAALLSYLSELTLAEWLLHFACGLFVILLLAMLFPSRKEGKATTKGQSAKSSRASKSRSKSSTGSASTSSSSAKNTTDAAASYHISKPLFRWPFRSSKKLQRARVYDPNSLNYTLDFLDPDPEKESKYFKHAKVTDYFRELIRPCPVMDASIPELDDTDRIFSTMLKAGAVSGKLHLVTNYEHQYLEKLRLWFGERCYIYCQVSVGSSVHINADVSELNMAQRRTFAQKCNNMSFDFMLIDKQTDRIVCAIELDDPTHKKIERKLRDRRLDWVCKAANIPIYHITNINQKPDLSRIRL